MPRLTERPTAFLVEATNQLPCVMLDHAKAVDYASFRHGTITGLVRESLLINALETIRDLRDKLDQRTPENEGT